MRFGALLGLALVLVGCLHETEGCDTESPTEPTRTTPPPPTTPSTYNDVDGCISLVWEGSDGIGCGWHYFRFVNSCDFPVRVTWRDNAHGRSKAETDQEATASGGKLSWTIEPHDDERSYVACPGNGEPYITYCYHDPEDRGACRVW